MVRLYNTAAASARFWERHGVKLSPAYLRKLRSQGKGPEYVLFNGLPHYTDPLMDAYVEANTSAPARSGVEHEQAGHRRTPQCPNDVGDHAGDHDDIGASPTHSASRSARGGRSGQAEAASAG